ncbi:hypothetical protein MCANPG14_01556 [Mycoplasmopsis canis PG 14]|uniref:Phosphomevalonate kinase n=1 Tax=Mycoplasmopsis canis TaxID=29555 RepID=A0A449ARD9_9BACT|nr:hypothetical protein [Mycoplasmopsis canis]AMD81213.1 hypothetical protein AXW82_01410 [Mycoplasmopsis canis PG 14]EIE39723.1 hypothetical protein MCANPG14_01556 [Mycoplasmopsis canis PG 14]VEU69037.1 phosphomevalonate kinase [Mycoplasmopsis canis]
MKKNKHIIVLINGKRRSGKGLLTNAIKEKCFDKFKGNVHILSFAQPIKDITQPILNELKWDGQNKEVVRPLWIAMGEVGRNIDNNIWCGKVFEKIKSTIEVSQSENKNSLYLIDDLRFPNELDYFLRSAKILNDNSGENSEIKVVSIRIEKFMDAEKFVAGVDDNSTEISFDKLTFTFNHIVPQDTLIDRNWEAIFPAVDIVAKTVIENFIKIDDKSK